jgi:ATP-dependent helicase HepA
VDARTVTVQFLATGETRTYAQQTAPLTRVSFVAGDRIQTTDGASLVIESVQEDAGLLTYVGHLPDDQLVTVAEGELDPFIQLQRPTERLFTGQIDTDKLFELRYQTLQQQNRLAHSDLRGLTGGRTSLIPHQLYIAHEVANRYAPRVLLADEVGLGKTIEAGLILHQQLLTDRAHRVLIVVPESLLHQWLVEMLRRFNLRFSLFDEERCLAVEESTNQDNPFHSEQLVLCSLEFLSTNARRFQQAYLGAWDLLVVDEAHHLQWSPEAASLEYELIELLATETRGVLLLTATPEQLGKASHFARLRLLDPDRFPDFDAFVAAEQSYEPVAHAVEALLNNEPLDAESSRILADTIEEGDNQSLIELLQNTDSDTEETTRARLTLVEHLLDRHGTGRVLFRNTRAAVKGFPERAVMMYALPLPAAYATLLADMQTTGVADPGLLLCPERLYQDQSIQVSENWTDIDPRIDWLSEQLKNLRPAKVLVITASAQTAMDIAAALRNKTGMQAALFHEGLSIIERDRAAAFFADPDGGQVLVCSEIGSEGRNFQFAHHLVLFDLPLNPDLLEQRIGRLDRIGQTETIQLHVPYLENSAQAVMAHWYQEALDAFAHTCPAGHSVFVAVQDTLVEALHQIDEGIADLPALINTSRQLHEELNEALHRGRDRLLEYNSCRPAVANSLQHRAGDEDAASTIAQYMDSVFDCFGIDSEVHSEHSLIIQPGVNMQSGFSGVPDDGLTITYDRDTALIHEDMQFLTWDHPLVTAAMDMVTSSELGNTAVSAIKHRALTPGTLFMECLYVLESAASNVLQSSRYLPPTTIRVLVDKHGNDYADKLPHAVISQLQIKVDKNTANQVVHNQAMFLRNMVQASESLAQAKAPGILATAHVQTRESLSREIDRLKALQQVNPNVRDEEIEHFEQQWALLNEALATASPRLDAVRVIVVT